jgi:hypothetical protein
MDIAWYDEFRFRAVKEQLEVVGHVEVLDSDPKDSNFYRPWIGLGERAVHKREWTRRPVEGVGCA